MSSLAKRFCLALLILPCAAWADSRTATVSMHASGTMSYDPVVYEQIGWTVSNPRPQAYDLTASMSFFLDDERSAPYGTYAYGSLRDVTLSFSFDGKTYQYIGMGGGHVNDGDFDANPSAYELQFGFFTGFAPNGLPLGLNVTVGLDGPPGTFDPVALAAQRVRTGGAVSGYAELDAVTLNGDLAVYHVMNDPDASVTLNVLSPVPEPAPFGMLAAGLLPLAWRRWRRYGPLSSTA